MVWNDHDNTQIDSKNSNVLPGHLISLKIHVTGDNPPDPQDITWEIDDETFASYVPDAESAIVQYLDDGDLHDKTVTFYWADTGSKQVSVSFTLNGIQMNLSETFSVAQPVVSITAGYDPPLFGVMSLINGDVLYGLVNESNNKGIQSFATVSQPEGFDQAQWAYVQILQPYRYVGAGGPPPNNCVALSAPEYGLDTSFPYAGPFDTNSEAQEYEDTPTTGIVGRTQVNVNDTFLTFIMFKPNDDDTPIKGGSAWVSLYFIGWSATGCAEVQPPNGWQPVTDRSIPAGTWSETTEQPVWNFNVNDLPTLSVACVGPCATLNVRAQSEPPRSVRRPTPTKRPSSV